MLFWRLVLVGIIAVVSAVICTAIVETVKEKGIKESYVAISFFTGVVAGMWFALYKCNIFSFWG